VFLGGGATAATSGSFSGSGHYITIFKRSADTYEYVSRQLLTGTLKISNMSVSKDGSKLAVALVDHQLISNAPNTGNPNGRMLIFNINQTTGALTQLHSVGIVNYSPPGRPKLGQIAWSNSNNFICHGGAAEFVATPGHVNPLRAWRLIDNSLVEITFDYQGEPWPATQEFISGNYVRGIDFGSL
jgi:hypothetical protein